MTPDEAAKAEAESIATRWVPAHMTARQGMVDDIAAALVTERRLVEEAQARSAAYDRDRQDFAKELLAIAAERDRLKGELAEARRILLGYRDPEVPGSRWADWHRAYVAFIAAPPAEQAQPTESRWCHVAPACISLVDHAPNMRCPGAAEKARVVSWKVELDEAEQAQPSVAHAKQVASQDAHAAEQAQGEGALTLEMLDEVLRDHINDEYDRSTALAKRVEALETWLREFKASANEPVPAPQVRPAMGYGAVGRELMKWKELAAPPPPEAAGPAGTFSPVPGDTNSPWCQHCGLHISRHRAPTATTGVLCPVALNAEAAGPGHRFICSSGFDDNCGPSCVCKECDHRLGGHAVPPIPEGK